MLVVEDDPMVRIGLKHLLGNNPQLEIAGIAENSYEGIEAAMTIQPDVVSHSLKFGALRKSQAGKHRI